MIKQIFYDKINQEMFNIFPSYSMEFGQVVAVYGLKSFSIGDKLPLTGKGYCYPKNLTLYHLRSGNLYQVADEILVGRAENTKEKHKLIVDSLGNVFENSSIKDIKRFYESLGAILDIGDSSLDFLEESKRLFTIKTANHKYLCPCCQFVIEDGIEPEKLQYYLNNNFNRPEEAGLLVENFEKMKKERYYDGDKL